MERSELAFPVELLKPMYELFLDMTNMYFFVNEPYPGSRTRTPEIYNVMLGSNLVSFMKQGLGALPQDDLDEI